MPSSSSSSSSSMYKPISSTDEEEVGKWDTVGSDDENEETEQLLGDGSVDWSIRSPRRPRREGLSMRSVLLLLGVTAVSFYWWGSQHSRNQQQPPVNVTVNTGDSPRLHGSPETDVKKQTDGHEKVHENDPTAQSSVSAAPSDDGVPTTDTLAATTVVAPTLSPTTISSSQALTQFPTQFPTPAQTQDQTLTETTITYDKEEDPLYTIHLPFGDNQKQYRRVCSPVHSSLLCLTVLYPNPFEPQDPAYSYPHPVDEQVYDYDPTVYFMDGPALQECRNLTTRLESMDDRVESCLNRHAQAQQAPTKSVVAIWTKGPSMDEMEFYGFKLNAAQQEARVDQYFDGQIVMILGDSTGPTITLNLKRDLFVKCSGTTIKPTGSPCNPTPLSFRALQSEPEQGSSNNNDYDNEYLMDYLDHFDGNDNLPPSQDLSDERDLGNRYNWGEIPDDIRIFVGNTAFHPQSHHNKGHWLPKYTLPEAMNLPLYARTNRTTTRKISFVALHAIAHTQSHRTMTSDRQQIYTVQTGLTNYIMQVQNSEQGRQMLAQAGYELGHIIAFDGRPQFNPTSTGGWGGDCASTREKFLNGSAFVGWQPEWGSQCRGPLPSNSPLKKVLDISRRAYESEGLDMRFYGRTWEFNNLFWYGARNWAGKYGLDCTHSTGRTNGLETIHSYFLMAMIDDHYDQQENKEASSD